MRLEVTWTTDERIVVHKFGIVEAPDNFADWDVDRQSEWVEEALYSGDVTHLDEETVYSEFYNTEIEHWEADTRDD